FQARDHKITIYFGTWAPPRSSLVLSSKRPITDLISSYSHPPSPSHQTQSHRHDSKLVLLQVAVSQTTKTTHNGPTSVLRVLAMSKRMRKDLLIEHSKT
ncbi:17289_t:CDS:1, partial [Acaulospora colombiana]